MLNTSPHYQPFQRHSVKLTSVVFALALSSVVGSAGCARSPSAPAAPDSPTDGTPDGPAGAPADSPPPRATPGAIAVLDGLINLAGVGKLPNPVVVAAAGHATDRFHLGVFTGLDQWTAFAAAAGVADFADVDWTTQMVVYVVLDAQTNELGFKRFELQRDGHATLHIDWLGIEPYYQDSTPAVLALVARGDLDRISVTADGATLGAIENL